MEQFPLYTFGFVLQHTRNNMMNKKWVFISVLIVLWATSNGCDNPADSPATSNAEIVGTYKGQYAGGAETLELHADGIFMQTFRGATNTGYTLTGKWVYETNMVWKGQTNKISRISFKPFTVPAGESACTTNTKLDGASGTWCRSPVRIEIGPWPYFVRKVQDDDEAGK